MTRVVLLALLLVGCADNSPMTGQQSQQVERFRSVNGLTAGWRRFVQDAGTLKDLLREDKESDLRDGSSLTVADRAIAQNRVGIYLDGMTRKMENTIDDLFSN
jgi:hypothetical protein